MRRFHTGQWRLFCSKPSMRCFLNSAAVRSGKIALSPVQIESIFSQKSVSFFASRSALKSMNMLYCGSDDAMSCPSQLSMFPRIGCVFRLSTFTRSATSSQYARFAVMIYSVFPSTLIATSVIMTAKNA